MRTTAIIFLLILVQSRVFAQETLTLEQAIDRALSKSISYKKNKTALETSQWRYREFQSYLKPQVKLSGNLPMYRKESVPVFQEDGSIQFRNVHQSQNDITLSVDQGIAATGGRLSLSSVLNRADNFDLRTSNYGSSPLIIGYDQPLSSFNELKWAKKLEPVRYNEGMKEFVEEREEISLNTARFFFDWMLAQVNLEMANSNLSIADTILMIGEKKHVLGQISKDDLLRLKLAVIYSRKAVANARLEIKSTSVRLRSYAGLGESNGFVLSLPEEYNIFEVNVEDARSMAMTNSQIAVELNRRLLEAQQNSSKSKKESGLNANLSVKYGVTNVGDNIGDAYSNVQDLQTVSLGFSMPIIDWGRQKAKRKSADAQLKLTQFSIVQEEENLKQQVVAVIEQFEMLQELVEYTRSADKISQNRFDIATKRFMLGDIDITDLNIARDEKDQGKQDYIRALRSYWESYYLIRKLTLYDFENNRKLTI
ncbi:TolC family protein [Reichenbachiella versicolor]|uniref:TolC family protein n=1 Tax=Reichenbachiella versicolor TaxID=1821036 RepID=UPI000D6E7929|nr:TolC family protein [Reichenbachiella versicolor]